MIDEPTFEQKKSFYIKEFEAFLKKRKRKKHNRWIKNNVKDAIKPRKINLKALFLEK